MLSAIFRQFGINGDFSVNHERGVYVGQIYKNSKEFLRGEIAEGELIVDPRLEDVDQYLETWWKPKTIKRYEKFHESGQLDGSDLWYWDLETEDLESWLSVTGTG